ncbi:MULTISPECIES: nucleotide exchange factor GrpE [Bifidobacterium]|jgi:molecular chaperone GrpE|uniref:Protein GrpE n=1 Tax=Bifidobacterium tibiigranuli TaxID=2172043 RepID=A0A5N6S5Z0_9BIFI|nr:nucleotide exchange factor GrpE [Bifidobacterium tibiigranuli]KAE8129630.1 nucleotide exchange factor GrpE [Bifidobacterium tibiigranuli]KAE8129995.1 nucleotide exchange factor GrpE [Bifidobacterium tibiigranuli]MCH3975646.1 nucleotide exchange factor GrpE [Bifidobacterium tibiigranuli]MCH4190390.1 nucleotide exchange factor GrpE [Bifidobacterium tibiigranuli]MCH4202930.1 nucleotide exchange factor GrpE [Bifidobacterium tibiigranuli]
MSGFNKDDYLNDLPDADQAAADAAGAADSAAQSASDPAAQGAEPNEPSSDAKADNDNSDGDKDPNKDSDSQDSLTPLGQAKKEAAEYLDALQRERAEFVNFRNRSKKEQDRFREHGIIDVLTALLPALDDIDRIKEHSDIDDSFSAVATKIDKAFERFGVEKFGEVGEPFDPTKHEAILHKPDETVTTETVDTVVEAGYRIGDRVVRAARVVVASPKA